MLIMSWHEDIKLEKIQSLREGGIWNTDPALVQIREQAANFMAKFANTANLDLNADVYSDAEDSSSGSDVAGSDDSARYQDSDNDDDDGDSDGADRRIPPGVRFIASGKAVFDPDTSSSDASLDSDLAEFDEQAPTSDAAKTGETSSAKADAAKTSDPAGSGSAPHTESSPSAPEADEAAKPASPAPTPAITEEPTPDATPAVDSATADAASA